jgi:hypothetical protein
MKYVINNTGIVFFHQNKPVKICKSSNQYLRILSAFNLPKEEQEQAVLTILEKATGFFESDGFTVTPDEVSYQGEVMPLALASKIRAILEEGLPVSLFAKFWENLQQNPSANSVRELYDFLAYKELPITEDGCFLAYKGLDKNYWSISGNTTTKVLKGKVNNSGHIYNGVGEEIEVRRWDVDDNRENHCSFGLHVGSLDYAQDFSRSSVVVVKVNPKDVVSVPSDYNCQKCRVSAYKVVEVFSEEIGASVCYEDGSEMRPEESHEYYEFLELVDAFMCDRANEGYLQYPIPAIQSCLTLDKVCQREIVIDALNSLGYVWEQRDDGVEVVNL